MFIEVNFGEEVNFCPHCGTPNDSGAKSGDKRPRSFPREHREPTEDFMERLAEKQTKKFAEMLDTRYHKVGKYD